MITRWCHEALGWYHARSRRRFLGRLGQTELAQRQRLRAIVDDVRATEAWKNLDPTASYEILREQVPVAHYATYQSKILEQRDSKREILTKDLVRFEPTSGSTEARKWIPYSQSFLRELNRAASAWLGDLYHRFPEVKKGRHYWSLSWIPQELRAFVNSNDADLFPKYQRFLLKHTMAVPEGIANLESSEAAWWATLVFLSACENLALVSVWSPTFWVKVTEDVSQNWSEIAEILRTGHWGRHEKEFSRAGICAPRRSEMQRLRPEDPHFLARLWPWLCLLSAWDSSSSTRWANRLRELYPHVEFQGKGLWATEGVVSIPLGTKKVLAIDSHFYEFRGLETGAVVPAWKLELGKEYQPIVWASTGLLRYLLPDRIRVTEFWESVPCLEFLGRLQSTDMVGEKISSQWVEALLHKNPQWAGLCLVACHQPVPHYVLLQERDVDIDVESQLMNLHHYRVARELGQLQPARRRVVVDAIDLFTKLGKQKMMGQTKMEILLEVESL